jgi:peptide/nickel transport system substrate-binding protein
LRFNHLLPPFDNVKMRQAVLNLVDQKDYMRAAAGDSKYWRTCVSFFACGGPFETKVGAEVLLHGPNLDQAKALIAQSGYKGERIVLMDATDQPVVHGQALVTLSALRAAGLNVELQAMDWGTLITRRASKAPIGAGGWNIFHTWFAAPDATPTVNAPLRANDGKAWFGWPNDPKLETLIGEWFKLSDPEGQQQLLAQIQTEAYASLPYIPTGQFVIPTAYRRDLHGIIIAPVVFMWNVAKD